MKAFEIKTKKSDYPYLVIAGGFGKAVEAMRMKGIYDTDIISVRQLETYKDGHILHEDELKTREDIKDEVRQELQKPAWSEDDERMYKAISIALSLKEAKEYLRSWYKTPEEADNWLKSLKDRVQPLSQWKPTEEQIQALEAIIGCVHDNASWEIGTEWFGVLLKLKEQLKKL